MFNHSYPPNCNMCRLPGNYRIIDVKTGDVNGDGIPDTIFLTGKILEDGQFTLYERLNLIIRDGKTMQQYTIPLSNSTSYNPWLFLGDFTGSRVDNILVNMPTGGSGGLTVYYLVSFLFNKAVFLLTPDDYRFYYFNLEFEVIYRDFYKVDIVSKVEQKVFTLDIGYKKQEYEGVIYDSDGKLIKPFNGFIVGPVVLYPIKNDGKDPYNILVFSDICGTSHADRLGSLVSRWEYSNTYKKWSLLPYAIYVMI